MIAFEAQPIKGSSNQIIDHVPARLSLRTVPNMDGRAAGKAIVKKLTAKPPYGAKVTAEVVGSTPWWTTDPEGPAFEAARRALKAGYGKETAMIGAGGSIGFVGPFADLLGGAPCLLMGVEDPLCNAHSREREPAPRRLVQVDEVGHLPVRRAVAGADEEEAVAVPRRALRAPLSSRGAPAASGDEGSAISAPAPADPSGPVDESPSG